MVFHDVASHGIHFQLILIHTCVTEQNRFLIRILTFDIQDYFHRLSVGRAGEVLPRGALSRRLSARDAVAKERFARGSHSSERLSRAVS